MIEVKKFEDSANNNLQNKEQQAIELKVDGISDDRELQNKNEEPMLQGIEQQPSRQIMEKRITKGLSIVIITGIFLHFCFALSSFDVYVGNQIIPANSMPVTSLYSQPPLAKRVVFIQFDGGRADAFFGVQEKGEPNEGQPRAPYINDLITSGKAVFGISKAVVPTESKICVAAMIGGYSESFLAVVRGYVDASLVQDTINNYLNAGWYFGPLFIENLFQSKNCPECITRQTFDEKGQNFSDVEGIKDMDSNTVLKFKNVLANAVKEQSLKQNDNTTKTTATPLSDQLNKDQVMVFINLFGSDCLGHIFKPYSSQYKNIIRLNGENIQKIVEEVEKFYDNDGKTAFIMTSDHGMNIMGAHGDGSYENTITPFVTWGAGINLIPNSDSQLIEDQIEYFGDEYYVDWGNLKGQKRLTIEQNQIAPLLGALLKTPIPTSNEGIMPVNLIQGDEILKSKLLLQNALQIAEYYSQTEKIIEKQQNGLYVPFSPSAQEVHEKLALLTQKVEEIEKDKTNLNSEKNKEALLKIQADTFASIQSSLDGRKYIELYLKKPMQLFVTLGYVSFALLCLVSIFSLSDTQEPSASKIKKNKTGAVILCGIICILAAIYLKNINASFTYYGYFILPIVLVYTVISRILSLSSKQSELFVRFFKISLVAVLGAQFFVIPFFWRSFVFYSFAGLAIYSALNFYLRFKQMTPIVVKYCIHCLIVSAFTFFPPLEQKNYNLFACGFILITLYFTYFTFFRYRSIATFALRFFTVVFVYGGCVAFYIEHLFTQSIPVPSYLLNLNRLVLASLILSIPFLKYFSTSSHHSIRFYSFSLILSNIMILLSFSYDILFFFALILFLSAWIKYEIYYYQIQNQDSQTGYNILSDDNNLLSQASPSSDQLTNDSASVNSSEFTKTPDSLDIKESAKFIGFDLKVYHLFLGFKLLLLLNLAFFGTGNLISISGFNLESSNRLVISFHPLIMGGLFLLKLITPFLLSITAFVAVCKASTKASALVLFVLMLIFVEFVNVTFFFLIRTDGSWQEQGSSMARFIISNFIVLTCSLIISISIFVFKKATSFIS